ncbi:hypothetical protein MKW94_018299, partial [Papaver nudicaule]|nr:hypothetical protein [Papaver nudicaule]
MAYSSSLKSVELTYTVCWCHCNSLDDTVLSFSSLGAFLVNTGSSQLLDDCALKQLLIDGTIAGCALDGAEGPQWIEAWSIRVIHRTNITSVSDEDDEENESGYEEEQSRRQDKERALRDPAAQFLVAFKSKDTIGLRSFAAGGKLLQINRRMEFVFASHSFDVWENWALEGSFLEECRLVNCRNPS